MGRWNGFFELAYRDRHGRVVHHETAHNTAALTNGGEEAMLGTFFRGAAAPASFYLRLWQNSLAGGVSLPLDSHTIADLRGEASGDGYAAAALARNSTDWPTLTLDGGDWMVGSKAVSFAPASGVWTPFNIISCVTTTGAAGPIISYAKTQAQRTLDFDTPGISQLDVIYYVKLS